MISYENGSGNTQCVLMEFLEKKTNKSIKIDAKSSDEMMSILKIVSGETPLKIRVTTEMDITNNDAINIETLYEVMNALKRMDKEKFKKLLLFYVFKHILAM